MQVLDGRIVAVVGNAGAGKTTLTRLLCKQFGLVAGWEQQHERPFQSAFAGELTRFALANQIDYLLVRAEQERTLRQQAKIGIQDGGFDEDFFVFTHYFRQRGYLSEDEFGLCERLYQVWRSVMPMPELVIWLDAPLAVVLQRHAYRQRSLEIAQQTDLAALDALLHSWMATLSPPQLLRLDASIDDPYFSAALPQIEQALERLRG